MTVCELIADLQENFQDYMDLEVRIGTTGRGNYLACKPVAILSDFAGSFVTIPAQGTPAGDKLTRE